MTEFLLVAVLIVLLGGFAALFIFMRKRPAEDGQGLLLLQNQLNELNRVLDSKLSESAKGLREQFSQSTKLIKDITQELVRVGEGQKQVMNVTDQLKNLQDILKNPKQRGVLGEYYLETVLQNVLPPGTYQMQYPLGKDEATGKDLIVDAAVFVKNKVIPIDSKFSLENYNRLVEEKDPLEKQRLEKSFIADLKMRIDETAKYIKPQKNTMEFAFMFIPHEAVYYDFILGGSKDLVEYATREKHVIIVSPTSFLAYLQTVLQGLKALQIEESAKEIRKNVEQLTRHLTSYESYFRKLGTHLNTTYNMYTKAYGEFKKVDKDIYKITGETMEIEPFELEAPKVEEEV